MLRGKPIVVAAYVENYGCILAASREAKALGIKTGMRVREGKLLYPHLIVLSPDPEKYCFVNRQLQRLLSEYSSDLSVESIDEMVMDLARAPRLKHESGSMNQEAKSKQTSMIHDSIFMIRKVANVMQDIGKEIKRKIQTEIGEWLTVSIGIAPNRYLAKIASGLHKPDGLDIIDGNNVEEILGSLVLEDLCGIKEGNATRLRIAGIATPLDFYRATPLALKRAFRAVTGYFWWLRLHGYEEAAFANSSGEPQQKSFGQSYALGRPYLPAQSELHQILYQLVAKMGKRLRDAGFLASGVHTSCLFADHTYWNHGEKLTTALYADNDFYQRAKAIILTAPAKPVRILAVNCFNLQKSLYRQENLFFEEERKRFLTRAIDQIADRWGNGTVTSGRVLGTAQHVLDRIAFGRVKELRVQ